ncbi:FecR domain-containing protein [Deferribacter abyssi]|uniref:FecR domain-containing protein n=1 Tax=Deferribacter abyssi TaxID=213806 RepID=UPI003C2859AF
MHKKVMLFLLITITLLVPNNSLAIKIYFGKISELKGTPLINGKVARKRKKVYVGDKIITDSRSSLSIFMRNKTIFVISPNSEVILKKTDKRSSNTEIELKKGSIRSIVSKLKPKNKYSISSAGAVAGVKGTEFIAYSNSEALCVFTDEGVVNILTDNGSVSTRKGEMTQASKGIIPLEPVRYEDDEKLKEMFQTLLSITDFKIPDDLEKSERLPDIIARWNINYASYLADAKKYDEAIKSLDYAYLFAKSHDFKAEALYKKSIIMSKFINDLSSAKKYLSNILMSYKDTIYYEYAIFQMGFIAYEQKDYIKCKKYFNKYKEEFPNGRFTSTVNVILNMIQDKN